MDCDSDYDDSVVFKHGEINRTVARFNLSPEEDVQFRKRMEELELKAKADPGSESATLIKEIGLAKKCSKGVEIWKLRFAPSMT